MFVATKRDCDTLADELIVDGIRADALHGDMQQRDRTRTLTRLRSGQTEVLVATDVAARGIDVAGISHVINFDLPRFAEDYVHRVGRTGRAGATGTAVSLVGRQDAFPLKKIERFTGQKLIVTEIEGMIARFNRKSVAKVVVAVAVLAASRVMATARVAAMVIVPALRVAALVVISSAVKVVMTAASLLRARMVMRIAAALPVTAAVLMTAAVLRAATLPRVVIVATAGASSVTTVVRMVVARAVKVASVMVTARVRVATVTTAAATATDPYRV